MQKELNNDQRSRLENIARDEFSMRQNEIHTEKMDALKFWKEKEINSFSKTALFKELVSSRKKYKSALKKINLKGFSISPVDLPIMNESNYSGISDEIKIVHPQFNAQRAKTKQNPNEWRRALNEVLSVIWSMEKTFDACMSLIHKSVSKIK